ncbi:hypothetical protein CEXT_560081 [Caerostris extrusa]|uniref:Uncharacterized protein n=1 Tax=Caerostris extrusa TaxID=172846 RepID=A0AAV4XPZ3_CAEEX|nr:hypothetical protein CEXT_560081 [Caerostris extrusa]
MFLPDVKRTPGSKMAFLRNDFENGQRVKIGRGCLPALSLMLIPYFPFATSLANEAGLPLLADPVATLLLMESLFFPKLWHHSWNKILME